MDVRLTRAGNRVIGLAMMMLVSAVIGSVVVAAAKSPPKPVTPTPPAAAPAVGTPSPTPLPVKYVVLTFDDGPDLEYTPKVLDVLAQYDAKATFFEVGQNVSKHPELTKRVHAAGHSVQ